MHFLWTCDALFMFRQLFRTCDEHGHEYVDFGHVMDVKYVIYVCGCDICVIECDICLIGGDICVIYEIYVLFVVMECKKTVKKFYRSLCRVLHSAN
jgi:hypothetical protein